MLKLSIDGLRPSVGIAVYQAEMCLLVFGLGREERVARVIEP